MRSSWREWAEEYRDLLDRWRLVPRGGGKGGLQQTGRRAARGPGSGYTGPHAGRDPDPDPGSAAGRVSSLLNTWRAQHSQQPLVQHLTQCLLQHRLR